MPLSSASSLPEVQPHSTQARRATSDGDSWADTVQPFENLGELRGEHDRLLERYGELVGNSDSVDGEVRATNAMQSEITSFVSRALATGVVLDVYPERTTAQALIDYWVTVEIRCGHDLARHRLAGFDALRLPELDAKLCPYVGLEPFHDRRNFFGRETDIDRLAGLVAAHQLVIVHGSSGSGKSSLVFGGLLPGLRAGSAGSWSVRSFTPGDDPAARLGDAKAARVPADPARQLIVIDQFEELFTVVSEAARERFDLALAGLLAGDPNVHVVLTVREEFYARLSRLSSCATYADFSMRPLGYADLVAAIEKPAAGINLTFERGVVETLVAEVLGQPAALPLLQFSLLQLWNARSRNRITREALDRIGGPRDALARAADAFVDRQIAETKIEIERVLVELVRVDDLLESYRQPVKRSVLTAAGNPRTLEVISLLEQADLVRVTTHAAEGEPIVELKHEAIIRNWPRLDAWIVQKRKARRNQLALLRSAQAWDAAHRPAQGLYRGWQLQEAAQLDGLSGLEREFVEASKADMHREVEEAKQRAARYEQLLRAEQKLSDRRRALLYGVFVALVVVGGFSSIALWVGRRQAHALAREAETAQLASVGAQKAEAEAGLGKAEALRGKAKAEADADELRRKLADLQSGVTRLTKLKEGLARFRTEVIASRDILAGRYVGIISTGQLEDGRGLASIMRAAGMRSDFSLTGDPIPYTFLQYYYVQDKVVAERLVALFGSTLGLTVKLRSAVNDPNYFGPGLQRPVSGLLELYFANGEIPWIADPSRAQTPAGP